MAALKILFMNISDHDISYKERVIISVYKVWQQTEKKLVDRYCAEWWKLVDWIAHISGTTSVIFLLSSQYVVSMRLVKPWSWVWCV